MLAWGAVGYGGTILVQNAGITRTSVSHAALLVGATLLAYGQARIAAEVAGAFVNLEPLVGVAAGAVVFGDPVGLAQAAGGAAIPGGIALGTLPLGRANQAMVWQAEADVLFKLPGGHLVGPGPDGGARREAPPTTTRALEGSP